MGFNKNQSWDDLPVEFGVSAVGTHTHVASAALANAVTLTKPATATAILMQDTGTQAIRFTLDGTTPEAAVGFQLRSATDLILIPVPGTVVKVIREADGAALDYQWCK
jgi:hypothetical protein